MVKKSTKSKSDEKTKTASAKAPSKKMTTAKVADKVTTSAVSRPVLKVAEKKPKQASGGFAGLKKWNLVLGLLMLAQAVALCIYASGRTMPVAAQYTSLDTLATAANGHQVLAMTVRQLFDISLPILASVALAVYGLRSLLVGTKLRARYEASLTAGGSLLRWVTIGVGGGVMMTVLALLAGLTQIPLLVFVFASTLLGSILMPAVERLHQERKDNVPHVVCGVALTASLLPWLAVALSLGGAMLYGGHISLQMWALYASLFILYFGTASAAHQRLLGKGKYTDALYTERVFLILMFLSASALAWQTIDAIK